MAKPTTPPAGDLLAPLNSWGPPRNRPEIHADRTLEIRPGWRLEDPGLEADAIDYWRRLGNLPKAIDPALRAKELVAGCYKDGRLIAVQTAILQVAALVRARFALLRVSTDPAYRRSHAASTLTIFARNYLEWWAQENPDERLAGIAGVVEAPMLADGQRDPYWAESGLGLIGFQPDGSQVRVSWFRHFRFE